FNTGGGGGNNVISWLFDPSADSHWQYRTCASGTCTTTASSTAVAADTLYTLRVHEDATGTIKFAINGSLDSSQSTNVPSVDLYWFPIYVKTTTTGSRLAKIFKCDFVWTGLN